MTAFEPQWEIPKTFFKLRKYFECWARLLYGKYSEDSLHLWTQAT